MDRLQIAIEKARAQRALVRTAANETGRPVLVEPAPMPVAPTPDKDDLWRKLAPFDLSARSLHDTRLMAREGGRAAAPFDLLRTRVWHQARQNGWRYIGIVSPTPDCGKTTAAANLAFSFSRQPDLRLMLLDLDLRRPSLARMLGQQVEQGMQEILRGEFGFADHALRLGENVAIGLNNKPAEAPSELLQSARTEECIAGLTEQYDPDLVLFDLPPMLCTDDNFGFLSKVDAVLLMVAAEETTHAQTELCLRQLKELTTVMGLVLNKCRHSGGLYGYSNDHAAA
ncbi:exopolysaccharide biosynthesis protein [Tropicimonas sp. TH_r6]|uniref:nucleotide-binding protein n=1 Tax=Tropicimonas sp. TH_r6 TaxID=3082085 RepID=UPI002955BDE7|nr:exopolysaccharide biosynthesis protein [Tropicimonas sp. TH_r6]MDV7141175.1 exopolysaccharide biosynthesis protein [Tropicimonas sp. TH_r6]